MKLHYTILWATGIFIFTSWSLSAQPPSAIRSQSRAIVPDLEKLGPGFAFEMTGTNHFYVEVKLNGEGPFRLIFDLGAPVTLLSNKAAKESKTISPNKRPSFLMGMQGEGTVKEMQFGDSKATDIPVMIFDHPAITAMSEILGKRFDGILGYTFFARYRTTIDYEKKRLWFEPVRESTDNLVAALPDRMLNPGKKTPSTEVVPRHHAIGIEIEMQPGDNATSQPPAVKVSKVLAGSPAEKAGIKAGDVLISFGPHWLFQAADLADALHGSTAGEEISVVIKRDKALREMKIRPERVY